MLTVQNVKKGYYPVDMVCLVVALQKRMNTLSTDVLYHTSVNVKLAVMPCKVNLLGRIQTWDLSLSLLKAFACCVH